MDRRSFLKGLVATAAGVLVPGQVLAEPERRVWALDRTMVASPAGGWFLETGWFNTNPPPPSFFEPYSRVEELQYPRGRFVLDPEVIWMGPDGRLRRGPQPPQPPQPPIRIMASARTQD